MNALEESNSQKGIRTKYTEANFQAYYFIWNSHIFQMIGDLHFKTEHHDQVAWNIQRSLGLFEGETLLPIIESQQRYTKLEKMQQPWKGKNYANS